jgi:hypothetical protein
VSFAAIPLCVASQRVFIVVRVKCDPQFTVVSEMADLKEQRICVKFCLRLGKTPSETHEMLKTAFGDNAIGRTQTLIQVEHQEHVGDLFLSVSALFTRNLFLQAKR